VLRDVGAIVAGLAVAFGAIMAIQMIGHAIWAPPDDIDWNDVEAARTYISQLPFLALLFPIASYFVGAVAGPFVAGKIGTARPAVFAGVIGLVLLAATIANLIQIPHPYWFSGLALAAVLVGIWLGLQLSDSSGPGAHEGD
jgi:disulfide bond formation protein DsbB